MTGRIHSLESFGTVDGPGIRFVTFLQGCPLRCAFCHNPDTWEAGRKVQYEMTPRQLLEETLRYESFIRKGGVTCTGGEPLMQAEFVAEYFRLCRAAGLHTALDTSGAIFGDCATLTPLPAVEAALQQSDLVMLDIKTIDPDMHRSWTGVPADAPRAMLSHLQKTGRPVWIRHVVVPGHTDSPAMLEATARYISSFSVVERVEILPYHTMGEFKYRQMGLPYRLAGVPPLSDAQAEAARDIFRGILHCRIS